MARTTPQAATRRGTRASSPSETSRAQARRVRRGNREFAGLMIGAAAGVTGGLATEDPVGVVLGGVLGAAVGAATAATAFGARGQEEQDAPGNKGDQGEKA
ncbi:MAG TPA: hypothetical protein VFX49_13670 [Chloroflexota bacterium]|nr:hypothetical protein [Chloroflexota bacterium]